MAEILVKRDSTIKLPELRVGLQNAAPDEVNNPDPNYTQIQQTKWFGIAMPILAVDGIVIDYNFLDYLVLDGTDNIPTIKFGFTDYNDRFNELFKPGTSNEVQVQILPAFDSAYKKINMLFYITKINIQQNYITGEASYKNNLFIKSQFKCLGQLTTYELFDKVSQETGLGLASNISDTDDKRYIYCDHKSYEDTLRDEILISGASNVHVYDWWIDFWNNIILCDIFDRYHSDDDILSQKIWIADNPDDMTIGQKTKPILVDRILSNGIFEPGSELYVSDYKTVNDTSINSDEGTTRVISVYNEDTKEYVDHVVADGDIKDDNFVKYEYAGEIYGGYNYLFAEECRNLYIDKMNSETIILTLLHPIFGIMRGEQIRLVWYDNSMDNVSDREGLETEAGLPRVDQLDTGWLKEYIDACNTSNDINMTVNLQISGQYTIIGIFMAYENGGWTYQLKLTRPASKKIKLIPDADDISQTIENNK